MSFKYINAVGAEAEGAYWVEKRPATLKHDGSVVFRRRNFKVRGEPNKFRTVEIGEVASPPLLSMEECEKWLSEHWPDKRNATCGFHIHLSFKNKLLYAYLMDKEFFDLFIKEAYEFGRTNRMSKEYFNRLDGRNCYCKKMFCPEKQIDHNHDGVYREDSPRYAVLNYCFRRHGTMENRLFPAGMTKQKAVKALKWYVEFVEGYLDKKQAEKPISFELENSEIKEEVFDLTEV